MIQLRDYQLDVNRNVWRAFNDGAQSVLLQAPTGSGKCHGAGTELVMFDGSLRRVEDILPGDELMGPDSLPRLVLSICEGDGELFQVDPIKGEPFVCNDVHVLSLKQTRYWQKNGAGGNGNWHGGEIVNISINEYLKRSATFHHLYKLWRVPVSFAPKPLPINPYFLGVLLGDGSIHHTTAVTTMDPEIVDVVAAEAAHYGLRVRRQDQEGNKSSTYFMTTERPRLHDRITGRFMISPDKLRSDLYSIGLWGVSCGDKFIPQAYKTSATQQRRELLAGLIDTDGCISKGGCEFASKSERLVDDTAFVARGVGLRALKASRIIKGVTYYRLSISGDLSTIPPLVARKQAAKRRQKKDVLVSGFSVHPVGVGKYYGFTLSGDGLYLLRDFTVTHNTICGAHLIAMRREHAREKVLVLAHRREIVMQTANKLMDAGIETGIIMANQAPMSWADVQVGSIDTLWARRNHQGFPEAQFLVVDEAHRSCSNRHMAVIEHYKAQGAKLLGMTATPMRNDGRGLKSLYDVMVRCPDMPELIEMGYLCPVTYRVGIVPDVKGVKLTAGDYNRAQLEAVMDAGTLIGDVVENWLKFASDRRTMVFAAGVAHSIHLMQQFKAAGISAVHIDGETDKPIRDRVFQQINSGEVQVICNAMVYTEGTDIPCISCVVDAAPSKSLIKYLQAGGRGMRTFPGKSSLLFMDHAGNVYRHGRLELPRDWELTEGKEQVEKLAEQRKKTEKIQITCPKCGFMFSAAVCPRCGMPLQLQGEAKDFLPAVLVEMTQYEYEHALASKRKKAAEPSKQDWYSGFLWIAQERGHAKGWAAWRFKEKWSEFPKGLKEAPAMPTKEVWNFDKFCRIKYAKARQKAAAPVGAGAEVNASSLHQSND